MNRRSFIKSTALVAGAAAAGIVPTPPEPINGYFVIEYPDGDEFGFVYTVTKTYKRADGKTVMVARKTGNCEPSLRIFYGVGV